MRADASPGFACSASAVTLQVLHGAAQAPVAAGGDARPCSPSTSGLEDLGAVISSDGGLRAQTAYATVEAPGRPRARAAAGVEGLGTQLLGLPVTADTARSRAVATCPGGTPTVRTTSRVGRIVLGTTPIVVDGVVQPVTDKLSDALGGVLSVRLDEAADIPGGGRAVRAADITVLRPDDSLVRLVVAESRVAAGSGACTATVADAAASPKVCPRGSTLDVQTANCVIPAPGSVSAANPAGDLHGDGAVVVGAPKDAPSGGSVLDLATARTRYPGNPCLRGPGAPYVVLGTAGADHVTGTNAGDRLLGLGGRDQLDGGRGDDCIDGGAGRDALTGGQGDDRVYGGARRDLVNGDAGNDALHGGAGDDTLNAAFGADRVFGGAGSDKINVATAGRQATVRGGSGADRVRCNPREVRRIRGVERVFVARREH